MVKRVTPSEAAALLAEGWSYLDVRSIPEFEEGHPAGAANVPLLHFTGGRMSPNGDFQKVVAANFATRHQARRRLQGGRALAAGGGAARGGRLHQRGRHARRVPRRARRHGARHHARLARVQAPGRKHGPRPTRPTLRCRQPPPRPPPRSNAHPLPDPSPDPSPDLLELAPTTFRAERRTAFDPPLWAARSFLRRVVCNKFKADHAPQKPTHGQRRSIEGPKGRGPEGPKARKGPQSPTAMPFFWQTAWTSVRFLSSSRE